MTTLSDIEKLHSELEKVMIRLLTKYNLPGSIAGQYSLYNALNREFEKMIKTAIFRGKTAKKQYLPERTFISQKEPLSPRKNLYLPRSKIITLNNKTFLAL